MFFFGAAAQSLYVGKAQGQERRNEVVKFTLLILHRNHEFIVEYIVTAVVNNPMKDPATTKIQALRLESFIFRPMRPGMTKPSRELVVPPKSPKTTEMFGIIKARPNANPASNSVTITC